MSFSKVCPQSSALRRSRHNNLASRPAADIPAAHRSQCNPTPYHMAGSELDNGRLIASHALRALVTDAPALALQGAGC